MTTGQGTAVLGAPFQGRLRAPLQKTMSKAASELEARISCLMAAKVPCCHPESVLWTKGLGISSVKMLGFFAEFILREMKRILRGVYPESNEKDPSLRSG